MKNRFEPRGRRATGLYEHQLRSHYGLLFQTLKSIELTVDAVRRLRPERIAFLEEARDALRRLRWSPLTHEVRNWPDHADYARLLRRTVDEAVCQAERDRGDADKVIHVLFSAHSLPLKIVERGDPYA